MAFPPPGCLGPHPRLEKSSHVQFKSSTPTKVGDLVNFLSCYSETLEALALKLRRLFGGTCRDLLDFIREQLHLKKFKPKVYKDNERSNEIWHYCDNDLDRMIAYVLHGGPAFPPTEMELAESRNAQDKAVETHESEGQNARDSFRSYGKERNLGGWGSAWVGTRWVDQTNGVRRRRNLLGNT
ncbi:hypothetical protein RUND412_001957 [Rhizina undulata]